MSVSSTNGVSSSVVLRCEHVKLRSGVDGSTSSRSSGLGTVLVFVDRVEWQDTNGESRLVVLFENIRGQRVSPPSKSKTQLQLCLIEGVPITFLFASPDSDRAGHVQQRDLLKDTLQQLLIAHRHAANKQVGVQSEQEKKSKEMELKRQLLQENRHLQALYTHLVTTNLISPADFWLEHFVKKDDNADASASLGVSSGFLSSIAQTDGCNDVKVNLNTDTIQAIFRTYPTVERKHLELVPHEMTEQQFWSAFFRSHYFHRDRAISATTVSDPFAQCLRADDADMQAMMDVGVTRKRFDITNAREELATSGDLEEMDASGTRNLAAKTLLKRFNYHSGRVLATCLQAAPHPGGDIPACSSNGDLAMEEREELESAQLAFDQIDRDEIECLALVGEEKRANARIGGRYSPTRASTWKRVIDQATSDGDQIMDADVFTSLLLPQSHTCPRLVAPDLSSVVVSDLEPLHDALVLLLRHFWACMPPQSPQFEQKLERMIETLRTFETAQLIPARERHGKKNVQSLFAMLQLAYNRYEKHLQRKTNGRQ